MTTSHIPAPYKQPVETKSNGLLNQVIDNSYETVTNVDVDRAGRIWINGNEISQKAAIDIARVLATSVEASININQRDQPAYYNSVEILRRADSKLGQAITALGKVFGL